MPRVPISVSIEPIPQQLPLVKNRFVRQLGGGRFWSGPRFERTGGIA
jgi:hypothetical protein